MTVIPVGSLQVAVNIRDGQTVQQGTYQLTVTPLNGQGSSFGSLEWYQDGTLLAQISPDADGTSRYDWKVPDTSSVLLTLKVYKANAPSELGNTQEFHIIIAKPTPTPRPSQLPTAGTIGLPPTIAAIINQTKAALQELPAPIRNGLPYALLIILAMILLLTYLQARQEVYHTRRLITLAQRDETLASNKTTLVQLASHYLRTPVTLLSGGLELGESLKEITPEAAQAIKQTLNPLKASIESSLQRVSTLADPILPKSDTPTTITWRFWVKPQFLGPIVLTSLVLAVYQWLATDGRSAGLAVVQTITQIAILAGIGIALMLWLRRRQINKTENIRYQEYQERQMTVDAARNQLITGVSQSLADTVNLLKIQSANLNPQAKSTRQINAGIQRLGHVASQFNLAAQLQSGHAADPLVDTPLQPLVAESVSPFQVAYPNGLRQFTITASGTAKLRHNDWIKFVLTSLLDNATTFTADGGKISITKTDDEGVPAIIVSDNGQGMPPIFASSVFQPFAKAEGALNFNHEGMGFSLYLDKLIMEYLGGSIAIASQPGKGTAVRVTCPTS